MLKRGQPSGVHGPPSAVQCSESLLSISGLSLHKDPEGKQEILENENQKLH